MARGDFCFSGGRLAAFENRRSFLSIDNLNYLIREIMRSHTAGDTAPALKTGIYNLADDEALSTNELVQLLASGTGNKARMWKINRSLLHFAARTGDLLHLPLNSERLKKLTESYEVSNAKLKKSLGIERLPVTAREGLEKTVKSLAG